MSVNPEIPMIEPSYPQQTVATTESLRLREAVASGGRLIGRVALAFGIAAASSIVVETGETVFAPQTAHAETAFTNDYPDIDADVYNLPTYDWWKDEDGNKAYSGSGELLSSRGYGYRNCTDGAAYWAMKYTGVNVAGWGNAKDWDTKSATKNYLVYSGDTKNIEPGDIAQTDDGTYGHVGFVTSVTKNADGTVVSFATAELNKGGTGEYTSPDSNVYKTRNAAGKFVRTGSSDWDHFIDLNGLGKGLNNEDIATPAESAPPVVAGPTFMPAVVQRPSGETDVAVVGPGNSLDFYYNAQGLSGWGRVTVPGAQAHSTPVMVQRASGETDIAVLGQGNSLDFYYNAQGSPTWAKSPVAVPGWAYSAPAVIQRPSGETDIAVQGPNNSLDFYYNEQGSPYWAKVQVAGAGSAYSAPAIVQRPSGETDIVVQGPGNSMDFYYNAQGSPAWGVSHVAIPNWAYSAPAVVQRSTGETDIAVQGPGNSLDFYINNQGSGAWGRVRAADEGTTYNAASPPALRQRSTGETDIAVQGPDDQAAVYYNAQGAPTWGKTTAAVNRYSLRAPAMVQRPVTGETDLVIVGPSNRLDFYFNDQGSPYWVNLPIAGEHSAS